jgi:hypothetical protein
MYHEHFIKPLLSRYRPIYSRFQLYIFCKIRKAELIKSLFFEQELVSYKVIKR